MKRRRVLVWASAGMISFSGCTRIQSVESRIKFEHREPGGESIEIQFHIENSNTSTDPDIFELNPGETRVFTESMEHGDEIIARKGDKVQELELDSLVCRSPEFTFIHMRGAFGAEKSC